MPPLGSLHRNMTMYDVWYGKTRMLLLSDGVEFLKIRLVVSTESMNVTNGRTDRQTPHDGIGRAYALQ